MKSKSGRIIFRALSVLPFLWICLFASGVIHFLVRAFTTHGAARGPLRELVVWAYAAPVVGPLTLVLVVFACVSLVRSTESSAKKAGWVVALVMLAPLALLPFGIWGLHSQTPPN